MHMLDVAAVAERLLVRLHFAPALRDALVLLVALHDLGKISDSFRAMIEAGTLQRFKHWHLTEAPLFAHDDRLASRIGGSGRHSMPRSPGIMASPPIWIGAGSPACLPGSGACGWLWLRSAVARSPRRR